MSELKGSRATIAVLGGTGAEGGGLAIRWAHAGHNVIIGSRTMERAKEAAERIAKLAGKAVEGLANREAAAKAEIVVLAVPYTAQVPTATEVAAELAGKILIDVTVPLVPPKVARVQLPEGGSAVDALQRKLGAGVKVVSAFQNVSAHQLSELGHAVDCDVLVCGDDEAARERVVALAHDGGMRAWHAGPLANSAAAEALTSILISINKRYKVEAGAGIRITGIGAAAGGH
ncbi:MAG: NADPH-dependent F420 reductase [Rhodospirillaceae bacterium]|nr:MAG: NADPH-dependent F420 reductase [Rhodospirillaceae bacterium]